MPSVHQFGSRVLLALTGVLIAAGLVAGPSRVLAAGPEPVFAERTQEGVALRLRVVPDPASGVSVRGIAFVAARAISGRARDAGFRVLTRPHREGTLDVWAPVARTSGELRDLLMPAGVAIYDLHAALATNVMPDPLLALAGRLGPARGGELYLTVPGSRSLNGPEFTRRALLGNLGVGRCVWRTAPQGAAQGVPGPAAAATVPAGDRRARREVPSAQVGAAAAISGPVRADPEPDPADLHAHRGWACALGAPAGSGGTPRPGGLRVGGPAVRRR